MYGTNKKVSSSSPQTKKRTTPPRNVATRRQDSLATAGGGTVKPPHRLPASQHAPYFGEPHDSRYPIVPPSVVPPPHPFEEKGPKTGFTIIPSLPDSIGGVSHSSPPSSSTSKNIKPDLPPYMNHPWPGVDGSSIYTPSSSLPSPYHPKPVSASHDDERNPSRYTAMPSWTGTGFSQQV